MKSYEERAKAIVVKSEGYDSRRLLKEFLELMGQKKTNLCVSVDLTRCSDILALAEAVGDEMCLLKTHVDIIEDFSEDFIRRLQDIAKAKRFMIFEDRKFADIGNTVKHQYKGGLYKISSWAHFTNAHIIPGEGIIHGLKEAAIETEGCDFPRGLLLLAEMSSSGSLATGAYTDKCVEMALKNKDFVLGFIGSRRFTEESDFIYMTPGVQLKEGTDSLGQQYRTPEMIVANNLSDVIIVGRGIYGSKNPLEAAREYRKRGWDAYLKRLSQ